MNDDREDAAAAHWPDPDLAPGAIASSGPDPLAELGGGGLEVWDTLARWRAESRRFALLAVIETRGFTPRKAGARMLVADDGEISGTVGGGAIEQLAIEEARGLLRRGGTSTQVRRHLTQELGMCCGGEMTIYIETIETAPRLFLFGAGYIAKPLASIAAACGFRVLVVDERPEWATADRFPAARVECRAPVEYLRELETTAADYAVVTTHDHAIDQRIAQVLLERPFKFIGMIGSVPKQRKFALRLRARGFGDEDIARLHTPLGVSIGASTPEEIAVSVMAELIAVRRGVPVGWEWVPGARAGEAATAEREARSETAAPSREEERR